MTQEQLRMQILAGIITEGQYKTILNEDEDIDAQIAALQKQIDILKKSKQNKGGLNLTPEQLSVFKKEADKLYKQTKAGKVGERRGKAKIFETHSSSCGQYIAVVS